MKKKRSSRRKNTNLLKLAEAGVIASIMTQNMAGTSLRNFITNENPSDGVTLMELFRGSPAVLGVKGGLGRGGTPAMSMGANWDTLWQNTKANAVPLMLGVVGTPIIFRAGKKFARPVLTPIRGLLKGSGVTV